MDFNVGFNQTRTSVIGKGGSIFEVTNSVIATAAFIFQVSATIAFVLSLWPIFFFSWDSDGMILAMVATAVFAFVMLSVIMYWFARVYILPKQEKEESEESGIDVVPCYKRDSEDRKVFGYEVNGVFYPSTDDSYT